MGGNKSKIITELQFKTDGAYVLRLIRLLGSDTCLFYLARRPAMNRESSLDISNLDDNTFYRE